MTLSSLFGGGGAAISSYSGGKAIATTLISIGLTSNNPAGYTRVTTQPTVLHHISTYWPTGAEVDAFLRTTPFTTAVPSIANCHTLRLITNAYIAREASSTHDLYFPDGIYLGVNTAGQVYIECSYV